MANINVESHPFYGKTPSLCVTEVYTSQIHPKELKKKERNKQKTWKKKQHGINKNKNKTKQTSKKQNKTKQKTDLSPKIMEKCAMSQPGADPVAGKGGAQIVDQWRGFQGAGPLAGVQGAEPPGIKICKGAEPLA